MKKTRSKIELPTKIVKIAPHTYCINAASPYRNVAQMIEFNKELSKIKPKKC